MSIIGYTFQADNYCAHCIGHVIGATEQFAGWAVCGDPIPAEENLDEIAAHFGIDRADERSFDSGEFPKVILRAMLADDPGERCGRCHHYIDDEYVREGTTDSWCLTPFEGWTPN